jgi:palmitoyltransferase
MTDDRQRLSSTPYSSSDEFDDHPNAPLARRGSEGWEVRQSDREELLRQYLKSIGETNGRYQYYTPEAELDNSDEEDNKNIIPASEPDILSTIPTI